MSDPQKSAMSDAPNGATNGQTDGAVDDPMTGPLSGKVKLRHVVIGLGIAFALLTAASGLAATINQWHDESPETRVVFGNVPGAFKLVFYTVIPILIVYGAVLFAQRTRNWERGRPDRRATTKRNVKRRFEDVRSGLWMQTLLREPGCRRHAQPALLQLPGPARCHDRAGDQPPATRVGQVPPRLDLPGLRVHR